MANIKKAIVLKLNSYIYLSYIKRKALSVLLGLAHYNLKKKQNRMVQRCVIANCPRMKKKKKEEGGGGGWGGGGGR